MGMELTYQGIPADSGFVELIGELAASNLDHASTAQAIPRWMRWGDLRGLHPGHGRENDLNWPEARETWAWCCAIVERYPDIRQRNFFAGKHRGTWQFMMSATYRKSARWPKPDPTDPRAWNDPANASDALLAVAFLEAPPIAPGVVACQGFPIQYIAPIVAAEIGAYIAAKERDEIIPHLDELIAAKDMLNYNMRDWWLEEINEFQAFWRAIAESGDGVLVVYD